MKLVYSRTRCPREREEAEQLKARLDDIEQQLAQEMEHRISDKTELEKELTALKKEISDLKMSLPVLSKEGWIKKMVTRMRHYSKDKDAKWLNTVVDTVKTITEVVEKVV